MLCQNLWSYISMNTTTSYNHYRTMFIALSKKKSRLSRKIWRHHFTQLYISCLTASARLLQRLVFHLATQRIHGPLMIFTQYLKADFSDFYIVKLSTFTMTSWWCHQENHPKFMDFPWSLEFMDFPSSFHRFSIDVQEILVTSHRFPRISGKFRTSMSGLEAGRLTTSYNIIYL